MSKQSDAKARQGYKDKATRNCGTCGHCVPVMRDVLVYIDPVNITGGTKKSPTQVGQKCGIGDFPVKKQGDCKEWSERVSHGDIFCVEQHDANEWQSVFPREIAELSQMHATVEDATAYLAKHCGSASIEVFPLAP